VPAGPDDRALLDRYAAAFENAGATALMQLLRDDAVFEMPPVPTWFTAVTGSAASSLPGSSAHPAASG
jgi:RNA polymerase sigma-70 factor (ECF subfamily)